MAGIGLELKKMIRTDSYTSLFKAYGLTTLMISGPYIFILVSMITLYIFAVMSGVNTEIVNQFISIMVYLLSFSIIISSFLQLTFFRYIADRLFEKEFSRITPNYLGVLLLQLVISVAVTFPLLLYFLPNYSILLKIIFLSIITVLSMIFISVVLLTGLKFYRRIIAAFLLAYCILLLLHFLFREYNLTDLFAEFLMAQVIIFLLLSNEVFLHFPTQEIIEFDFLKKENLYYLVGVANLFYTMGFWIDKYLFWLNPGTSSSDYPPFRYSPIYDFAMLIAYLTIIPTTSSFLLQIETQFSMIYPKFMARIFRRKSLADIDAVRNELTLAGRDAIYSLFKTQAVIIVAMFLITPWLLTVLKLPMLYLNLLYIMYVGAGLNVILWGLLSILYYTTRYVQAVYVSLLFLVGNIGFTLLSQYLGPPYYGYGFALSLLFSSALALIFLNSIFEDLTYTTFMMTD